MFFSDQGAIGTGDTRLESVFGGGVRVLGEQRSLSRRALYRQNVWVHAGVNLLSRGVAKTPIKSYQDNPQKPEERDRLRSRGVAAHPLPALIARPWEGGTEFRLKNALVHEYILEGRAPLWMDRDGKPSGLPVRLIPMRAEQITSTLKPDGSVAFYEWRERPAADPHRILPEDVIWVGFEDGVSPLEALARSLEIDMASQTSTAAFYTNGARFGAVVTTDNKLQPAQVESIEQQLRGDHTGPGNHFRTLVLANLPGAQVHSVGASSSEAQTVEHRKLAREEVAAGLHIPQPMLGILDRATFSNIETQTRMWVVDTLGEHYAMIESALNGQLIDRIPEWRDGGCFVEFDTGEILRGAPTQRAETYLKWLNAGTRTPNELRRLENLPRIDDAWADAIYVPVNLTPAGLPGGASNTPPSNKVMRADVLPPAAPVPPASGE